MATQWTYCRGLAAKDPEQVVQVPLSHRLVQRDAQLSKAGGVEILTKIYFKVISDWLANFHVTFNEVERDPH